jgi:hypothetical protein
MPRLMTFVVLLAAGLLLALSAGGGPAHGQDKGKDKDKAKAKRPVGTWVRESNGMTITFAIAEEDMKISVKDGDGNTMHVEAAYGMTKGGVLFGSMTKVTKKGFDAPTEAGDLFSMAVTANEREMTVSDLKGTHANDDARQIVEGVYRKQ